MLSRVLDFISRHRRKIIISSAIIGGSVIGVKYAQRKLIDYQERQAKEFIERTRRMQHFESIEQTCNKIILGMGSELTYAILKECSTDELLEQLRQAVPNKHSKVKLWEEIKIIAFTRLTTLVYASSMLVVALRVQMNVLGGYLYRDSTSGEKKISNELQQQYLSLIRYFIYDNGLKSLIKVIRSKVTEILGPLPLNKGLTLSEIEQIFWSIQLSLNVDAENDPNSKMAKYLLPPDLPDASNAGYILPAMCSESLDLLESDDAINICANNISRGFALAADAIAESLCENFKIVQENNNSTYNNSSQGGENRKHQNQSLDTNQSRIYSGDYNINSFETAVAKIIPIVSGITSKGFNSDVVPYNLATNLISFYVVAEKNKILGANIYETFSSSS